MNVAVRGGCPETPGIRRFVYCGRLAGPCSLPGFPYDHVNGDRWKDIVRSSTSPPLINFAVVPYSIATNGAAGSFHIEAELMYQPIGFRWAHNLKPYDAAEPQRFVGYYEAMSSATAAVLCKAVATQ
jgi:hypothetical protein